MDLARAQHSSRARMPLSRTLADDAALLFCPISGADAAWRVRFREHRGTEVWGSVIALRRSLAMQRVGTSARARSSVDATPVHSGLISSARTTSCVLSARYSSSRTARARGNGQGGLDIRATCGRTHVPGIISSPTPTQLPRAPPRTPLADMREVFLASWVYFGALALLGVLVGHAWNHGPCARPVGDSAMPRILPRCSRCGHQHSFTPLS